MTRLLHEPSEVRVGHRVLVHPEALDTDLPRGRLLRVVRVGAHRERAARDPDHARMGGSRPSLPPVRATPDAGRLALGRPPPSRVRQHPVPTPTECAIGCFLHPCPALRSRPFDLVGTFRNIMDLRGRNPDSGLSLATYLRWTKKSISVEPQCPFRLTALCRARGARRLRGRSEQHTTRGKPAPTDQPRRPNAFRGGRRGVLPAAAVLQARHDVTEMEAYEMLVEEAADAGTSVREVAHVVLAGSRDRPSADDGLSGSNRSRVTSQAT